MRRRKDPLAAISDFAEAINQTRWLGAGQSFDHSFVRDDLRITVNVSVQRAAPVDDIAHYRKLALEQLEIWSWKDCCDVYVPRRDRWRFLSNGTKECSKSVAGVLVFGTREEPGFSFRCTTHMEPRNETQATRLLATVPLSRLSLDPVRKRRQDRLDAEQKKRDDVKKVAKDAFMVGRVADAEEILCQLPMDRREAREIIKDWQDDARRDAQRDAERAKLEAERARRPGGN